MSFNSLGLSKPILKAIKDKGYETPSPIQAQAIPPVLEGRDVMAAAQTGTGKTAAFTLPLLEYLFRGKQVKPNHIRALILTPTRELAAQVEDNIKTYSKYLPLSSTVVFGGVKINPQMMKLRRGVDVLVATPGRLLDLYNQKAVRFNQLDVFILDEADRMLDMGFIHDIRRVMGLLPKQRQNLLFSATFSEEIRELAKTIVNDPIEISVAPNNATADKVEQTVYPVDKRQKMAMVTDLIRTKKWEQVLIFTKTKHGANKLTKHLDAKKITAAAIHGGKSQGARTKALANFKKGSVRVLVATDIAARGLDINQLPQVINFDLPHVPEDYVHRIGRTGRAGASGHAYSLVCMDDFKQLCEIERLIQLQIQREYLEGHEPVNNLPASPALRPPRKKKPKKIKPHVEHHDGQRSPSRNSRPGGANSKNGNGRPASKGKPSGRKPASGKPASNMSHFKSSSSAKPKRNNYKGKRISGGSANR